MTTNNFLCQQKLGFWNDLHIYREEFKQVVREV